MLLSIFIFILFVLIVALVLTAEWLVWHFRPYRAVRERVDFLSNVKISQFLEPLAGNQTLKTIGDLRIQEVFAVAPGARSGTHRIRVDACFGLMFVRRHAFGEEISVGRSSAIWVFTAGLLGLLVVLGTDADAANSFRQVTLLEWPLQALKVLIKHDYIAWLEVFTFAAAFSSVLHSIVLLRRLSDMAEE